MSNKSEQSEFILEKILGLKNMQEKLEKLDTLILLEALSKEK